MELEESDLDLDKGNLVEAAMVSLKRLNSTINAMKKWTHERATLQSDIYKLQVALHSVGKDASSILLSQDPFVKYQTEEIRRLESINEKMKTQIQNLNDALLHTKQTFSLTVHEKVQNQMVEINARIEQERQQLIREINNLRMKIENNDSSTKLQQFKIELSAFIKVDTVLDKLFSNLLAKVIDIINSLSNKLIETNQIIRKNDNNIDLEILGNRSDEPVDDNDDNDSEKLEYMSCTEEQELRDINFEGGGHEKLHENYYLREMKGQIQKLENDKRILLKKNLLKERALKRSVSTAKTKLTIALMKNKKLDEKIKTLACEFNTKLNSTQTDFATQTEEEVQRLQSLLEVTKEQLKTTNDKLVRLEKKWNNNNNQEQLETELLMLKNCNNDITSQLIIEQTTAKEALKQFERSTKEIERLEAELEDIKLDRATLQREIAKLKLENSELKNSRMTYKKKSVVLGEEGVKERESLQMRIKSMKLRTNKLEGDLKKMNVKNRQSEEIINELKEKNNNFQMQIEFLLKNSDQTAESLQQQIEKNTKLEEDVKQLKKTIDELVNDRDNLCIKLKNADENLERQQEEYLYLQELSAEMNTNNDKLKETITKNSIEIDDLTSRISVADNEIRDLKSQIETMTRKISALQLENEQMKDTINISKAENEKLTAELLTSNIEKNTLKSQLNKVENEKSINKNSQSSGLKDKKKISKDENNQLMENSKKKVNEEVEKKKNNKLVSNYEKTLKRNLHETEKELFAVKSELVRIKHDIESLKSDVEHGKYGMYNLEKENIALKEELAKLRSEKQQLIHEIQKTQTGKNYKAKEPELNVAKSKL